LGEAPPFVGVAVNVTDTPGQIVLLAALETILTDAGFKALTVMVTVLEVTGDPVTQPKDGSAVNTREILSLLFRDPLVYVGLLPALEPLSFH